MTVKVLSVIGTRPEAIKMAPVLQALAAFGGRATSVVCSTGQHRELLEDALAPFGVRPDFDLAVMEPDQRLAHLTGSLVDGLDRVVADVAPDWVVAQGDTTSVFAAALVAFYNGVRFGHVEAGLRTNDLGNPFPEEMNRRFADEVAVAMFAPTSHAREALLREGLEPQRIYVTGNTVVDALNEIAARPEPLAFPLRDLAPDTRIVLITAHRRESFGEPLRQVCLAVRELSTRFPDVRFVFPVHLNPHVREAVDELLTDTPGVLLTEPLEYSALVHVLKRSTLVLTDSGGIQEEAPSFGVPVLVLREKTERTEAVEAGVARVVGTGAWRIVDEASRLLSDEDARQLMASAGNPFGDGNAGRRIAAVLVGDDPADV